jgi:DNA replication protein DnaC
VDNSIDAIAWIPHYTPCDKCQLGFIVKDNIATKCECKIQYDNEIRLINSLLDSNLIEVFSSEAQYKFIINYTISSYRGIDTNNNKEKVEKYLTEFDSKFNSVNLFFSGEPGTQKTTMAKYIVCSLLKNRRTGYYIIANDLFNLLTDSERNEEAREKLKEIVTKDIVVIDEFDESKITLYSSDWKQKFILPWLKTRLETVRRSTIFISNKLPTDLGDKFDGAIQDLISRETTDTVLIFNDRYAKYKDKINITSIWDD